MKCLERYKELSKEHEQRVEEGRKEGKSKKRKVCDEDKKDQDETGRQGDLKAGSSEVDSSNLAASKRPSGVIL
eukprot:768545-Hanusia_phi.AAC.3